MSHHPRLKPLGQPKVVSVCTDEHGEPVHVRMPGKPSRRVAVVREHWRIDDEWWREVLISRTYFDCVLEDGRHVTLVKDLITNSWYRQRD